jgi:hypothetical protein
MGGFDMPVAEIVAAVTGMRAALELFEQLGIRYTPSSEAGRRCPL